MIRKTCGLGVGVAIHGSGNPPDGAGVAAVVVGGGSGKYVGVGEGRVTHAERTEARTTTRNSEKRISVKKWR